MVLSPAPTVQLVLGKAMAHWLVYGMALLLMAPVIGHSVEPVWRGHSRYWYVLGSGRAHFVPAGRGGRGPHAGFGRGSMLLTLLILPLYDAALIFGAGAVVV